MERNTGKVLVRMMSKVTLGVLLCLSSLILLHRNHAAIGIIAFVVGIVLMNGWQWPRQ